MNRSGEVGQIVRARYLLADPAEPSLVRDARVTVMGGRITAVEPESAAELAADTTPRHDLVLPGFINAHHHAYLRSPAQLGLPDKPLEPWLITLNLLPSGGGPGLATLASSIRQLRAGVTSVLHSDGPGPAATYADTLEADEGAARLRLLVGPLSPIWTSFPALEMMADLLRLRQTGLHTHFLESIHQRAYADRLDTSMGALLARLGLLDERTSLAHGVWTSAEDMSVLHEGQQVSFERERDPRGRGDRAAHVKLVTPS